MVVKDHGSDADWQAKCWLHCYAATWLQRYAATGDQALHSYSPPFTGFQQRIRAAIDPAFVGRHKPKSRRIWCELFITDLSLIGISLTFLFSFSPSRRNSM